MGKSAKIRRLIQKTAIVLAVILALPQMPMAQRMGLGYVEAHADPVEEPVIEKYSLNLGLGTVVADDKSTVTLTPYGYEQPNIQASGKVKYEYYYGEFEDSEEGIEEGDWIEIVSEKSMDASYVWTIPNGLKGKRFAVSAFLSDDPNYKDERAVRIIDLEAPVINAISDVTRTGDDYTFTITLNEAEHMEGAAYYYILTAYNESGYASIDPENIREQVFSEIEHAGNLEQNNTNFGTDGLLLDSTEIEITANGSNFEEGIYVFQVVVVDQDNNISEKIVTNPFITSLVLSSDDISASVEEDMVLYTGEEQIPMVIPSLSDDFSGVIIELVTEKLTYKFKRVKDKDGNDLVDEAVSTTVKEVGLYEIYAESTETGVTLPSGKLGELKVIDSEIAAPDNDPNLIVEVSGDLSKYVIIVDPSSITGIIGKSIEYSFNGGEYTTFNEYETEANEQVTIATRFAETEYSLSSSPKTTTIIMDGASLTPTITESGSFSSDNKTIEIKGKNETDVIYYTTEETDNPTYLSKVGSVTLNISTTTTVKAFAVETNKIKSDVVSATYTFVEAPDHAPVLNISVSEDKTKYIVTIDTSSVTNKIGKTVEYSFDGENYGTTNTYVADAEETVTAYIRFTATTNTVASLSRSSTTTTPGKSATPTLSKGGSFLTEKMSIDIIGTNVSDLIYYTTNNDDPTELSSYANGSTILENISSTTTVKAFVVENGKIRSDIVTATYTKITPTVTGVENDKTYNSKRTITIDKASNTTVTLKKDNEEPKNVALTNGSALIEASERGIYVLNVTDELGNVILFNFTIAQEEIPTVEVPTTQFVYTTKALSVDMFTVEDVTYSGVALKPVVVGKDGDKNLVVDNDFTVTYTNNIQVGTASATITGIGGYSGIVSITFTIIPNEVKVTGLLLKTKVYDGNTIMEVDTSSLKLEGISEKDADKVSIGGLPDIVEVENKNAGEKTAIIKVADLKLVQEDSNYVLSSEDITVVGTISKKKVVLMDMEFKSKYYDGSKYMTLTTQEGTIKSGVLEGDEVTFNTKSDRYVISGTANAGSKKRKLTKGLWKISGKDANNYTLSSSPIAKGKIYKIEVKKVTLKKNSVKYDGMGHKPIISQIFGSGGIKILQKNCKIEYLRNGKKTNDFKSKGTITVKVTGKTPNWKGSVSVNFKIK